MKNKFVWLSSAILSGFVCASEAQAVEPASPEVLARFIRARERVAGQYIVVLDSSAGEPAAVADEHVRTHGGRVGQLFHHALSGYVLHAPEAVAQRIAADPRVRYVEEDSVMHADDVQYSPTWGLDRIDQSTLPLSTSYQYFGTGAGVNAYVIDTGIRITHSEFGGRADYAFSSIQDGWGASDCVGHGTHVAATLGGSTYGVAKGVKLHSVRVLDCNGQGTASSIIAGVDWVTANRVLPAVANMSLGGGASPSIDSAVENSIASGVVYVVAAGNDSFDACGYSPARTPSALTVASTINTDARSSFSNWGTCVDLFAPGSNITSAWNTSDTATNTISGTSMASPHVAGAAAIELGFAPTSSPATVRNVLLGQATRNHVSDAGDGSPNALLFSGMEAKMWCSPIGYTGREFQCSVGLQGGAAPFRYEWRSYPYGTIIPSSDGASAYVQFTQSQCSGGWPVVVQITDSRQRVVGTSLYVQCR